MPPLPRQVEDGTDMQGVPMTKLVVIVIAVAVIVGALSIVFELNKSKVPTAPAGFRIIANER